MAGIVIGVLVGVAYMVLAGLVVWHFYRKGDANTRSSKSQFDYDTRSLDQISVTSEEQPRYNLQRQDSERRMNEQKSTLNSRNAERKGEPTGFQKPYNENIYENDNFGFDENARPSLKMNY